MLFKKRDIQKLRGIQKLHPIFLKNIRVAFKVVEGIYIYTTPSGLVKGDILDKI
jgi:hypothetical protein